MFGTSAAACVPAPHDQHQTHLAPWDQQVMDTDMAPQHQDHPSELAAAPGAFMSTRLFNPAALPQGTCFSQPTNTSSSLTDSTADSDSSGNSSSGGCSSSQQAPHTSAPSPATAALLCHSPSISTGPSPAQPDFPAEQQHEPASKRRCQHAMLQGMQASGGSGIDSHRLAVSCRPGNSNHSLLQLDAGASIPNQRSAAGEAEAGRVSRMTLLGGHTPHPAASKCSPAHGPTPFYSPAAATGAEEWVYTSPHISDSPAAHMFDAAAAAGGGGGGSSCVSAQAFLQGCASPAAVAAFAVLAHNKLLPVLALHPPEHGQEQPAAPQTALSATLAYMFILAQRGDLQKFDDTNIRTLLWMTESFFSQYRTSCKVAAFDYCFYAQGLEPEDPYVTDTLAEEVPAMIQLQRDILVNSDFRLLVTEQQLQYACSTLASASSSRSSSRGLGCSLAAIHQLVEQQVEEYQAWYDDRALATHKQQQQEQQEQQQDAESSKQQQQQPSMQLFPGEVVKGYLVSETTAAGAAGAAAAQPKTAGAAAAATGHMQSSKGTNVDQEHEQGCRQWRTALQDVSNNKQQQPQQHTQGMSHTMPAADRDLQKPQNQQQQQQQRRVQTRQQWREAWSQQQQQHHVLGSKENTAAAGSAGVSDSKRAKDQLLQLASKEQAVGSKRRRTTAVTAAAGEQAQERAGGVVAGLGAGGRRMLSSVLKTARSAAQYLGCGQQ